MTCDEDDVLVDVSVCSECSEVSKKVVLLT